MTQAAFELQGTDKRVLEIALKYGYASPTSFNIVDDAWEISSPGSYKDSSQVAHGQAIFKEYVFFIITDTVVVDLTLSCDTNGNLS